MVISEISLTPDNQQFGIVLKGVAYQIRVIWREPCWILDLMDAREKPIVMAVICWWSRSNYVSKLDASFRVATAR